jgi:hypothetical protein
MKLLDPYEAGFDEEGLKGLFFEEPPGKPAFITKWQDEIIDRLGEDKIINKLGEDKIINKLGEDKITEMLIKRLGKEKLLGLVEKLTREGQ